MHKDEASYGFYILSKPDRVKISKMLYVRGDLSFDDLLYIIEEEKEELEKDLNLMIKGNLITKNGEIYSINKDYVDSLLDFIKTPCGCCNH